METSDSTGLGTKRKRTDSAESIKIEDESKDVQSDSELSDLEDLDETDSEADGSQGGFGQSCYDESTEPLPECPAFDPEFLEVRQALNTAPEKVSSIIDQSKCNSQRVQSLISNAEDLLRMPVTRREKVAIVGNTGTGKSSLLNSVIGIVLAKAVSGAHSCTNVCTEYESPFPWQKTMLAAEITYLDPTATQDFLEKAMDDYDAWHFDQTEDLLPDVQEKLSQLSLTAFDTLRAMFCNQKEMQNPSAAEGFLKWACCVDRPAAMQIMLAWSTSLLENNGVANGNLVEYLEADNAKDMAELLRPKLYATSMSDNEHAAVWPLVKHVRIGIDGPQILRYITLVDLPGLDDTNQVRVNASYDTMRSCDTLWIVANIQRVVSDLAVDSLLMRYGKSFSILVICTGIDQNIDDELAQQMVEEAQSVGDWSALEHEEMQLTQSIIATKKTIDDLENKLRKLRKRNDTRGAQRSRPEKEQKHSEKFRKRLRDEKDSLDSISEEKARVVQQRYTALVGARNAYAERNLMEKKRHHLPGGKTLPVFCVSNIHYAALKGTRRIDGPRLDVDMTGLPRLRRCLLERAAPGILQHLEADVNHKYSFFMTGLSLWTQRYSGTGCESLLDSVRMPEDQITKAFEHYYAGFNQLCQAFGDAVLVESRAELISRAKATLEDKKSLAPATIKAFVKRDGTWETSIVPKQCWNEQLLEPANKIARKRWESFKGELRALEGVLENELKELVKGISQSVKKHPISYVLPQRRVDELLAAQLHGITRACQEHTKREHLAVRNIYLDLTQERPSGYFTKAMNQAYEKCKGDKGKGVIGRIFNTFEVHLALQGQRSPFAVVRKAFCNAMGREMRNEGSTLQAEVNRILNNIYDQFAGMVEQRDETPEERMLSEAFADYLLEAEPAFEETKGKLEGIKERYEALRS